MAFRYPAVIQTLIAGGVTGIGSPANGLSITSNLLSLRLADASHTGALSSTDWSTFNSKQSALTLGNLTAAGTDGIAVTAGTGAIVGAGTSIAQHVADASHNGYLTSTDWSTFNAKQATLSFSAPLSLSGATVSLPTINFSNTVVSNFQDEQDPTQGYTLYEEWDAAATTGRLAWTKTVVATGTDSLSGDGNHPGIQQMKAAAVSDSIVLNLSGATVVFGGGVYTYQCNVRFPTLSTNVEEYVAKIGMNNAGGVTTEGTNLVYFSYDRATDGNFFGICTRGGGTKQKTVSSLAVVANTWYTLRFIVNAAGTSVTFYGAISGSALASLGTIATQVPTTGVGPFMNLLKTVGSTQRSFENDYVFAKCTFTTAR